MRVSVFTPTSGGRPEALELCKFYVERQTHPIHEHHIESGGTLADNLRNGLPKLTGDVVVVFEDDDHYHPGWIEWCVGALQNHGLVGDDVTRYYHLPTSGYESMRTGPSRASLCNTAFHIQHRETLINCAAPNLVGIDSRFWGRMADARVPHTTYRGDTFYVTGMKGLPGTKGMGVGHRAKWYKGPPDHERRMLRKWVGDADASRYLELLEKWEASATTEA